MRLCRRGRVERPRGGGLPVDDEDVLGVVMHPPTADVERLARGIDVDPAEAESALRVVKRPQATRCPGLDRLGRALALAGVARAQ